MKKFKFLSMVLLFLPVFSVPFFSFNTGYGGDVFEIYLNGKQVHQQFVHADKSIKTIQLSSFNENDKVEVFYSHCGYSGKDRKITLRNEKNELVKEFKFANTTSKRSLMGFNRKDVGKSIGNKLKLYYSSEELPGGLQLATINWRSSQSFAKN